MVRFILVYIAGCVKSNNVPVSNNFILCILLNACYNTCIYHPSLYCDGLTNEYELEFSFVWYKYYWSWKKCFFCVGVFMDAVPYIMNEVYLDAICFVSLTYKCGNQSKCELHFVNAWYFDSICLLLLSSHRRPSNDIAITLSISSVLDAETITFNMILNSNIYEYNVTCFWLNLFLYIAMYYNPICSTCVICIEFEFSVVPLNYLNFDSPCIWILCVSRQLKLVPFLVIPKFQTCIHNHDSAIPKLNQNQFIIIFGPAKYNTEKFRRMLL